MKGDSVVKEIQIKNFRSLKDTGMQTLSPITLLVGENSSGKSTFLRAFPLLKQSISKRTSGPILWAGDVDDYVDFGSFEETVTNDKSNEISFAFKFKLKDSDSTQRLRFDDGRKRATDNSSTQDVCYEITVVSSNGKDRVSKASLKINATQVDFDIDTKTITTNSGFSYTEVDLETQMAKNAKVSGMPMRRYYIGSHCFGFMLPAIDEFFELIYQSLAIEENDELDYYDVKRITVEIGTALINTGEAPVINEETTKKTRQLSAYTKAYNKILSAIMKDDRSNLKEMAKLLAIYDVFREAEEYLYSYFKQVHYIAPLRATAERYYRLRNLAVDEVDYQGKNLPVFINSLTPSQLKEFQAWTEQHFGFAVSTDKNKGHLSLQIKLCGSDKSINLSDTGFGYSQVLPIITQLWELSSRKRNNRPTMYIDRNQRIPLVIAIEQPELHLHPAIQAKLAKAFLACIDLARKNKSDIQLLIETHSETIVNYFGRAIARKLLHPDDISVIFFEKDADQSVTTVRNSSYNADGFLTNWPYGFFDSEE